MKTPVTKKPATQKTVISWAGGAALLVASSLVLGGCTSPTSTPSTSAASTPATTSSETPTATPTAQAVAPLTGLPVAAPITTPSIASKIDNLIDARPQIGLEYTDMVFEELVEGGLTRYIAVWQSNIPKTYGPVRSIRGMDPSIVSPLGGLITYSGGQPIFVNGIKKTDIVNVSDDVYGGDTKIFHRTSAKAAPHNLLASGQYILGKFGKGVAAPAQQFSYAADAASTTAGTTGTAATKITAQFSAGQTRTWAWDATDNLWKRSQNGVVDKDDKGNQISAVNVVTLRVKLKTISHTPVSQLIGGNVATVSTGGKTVTGTWKKDSLKDPIHLLDSAGNPITLTPGNTWIELVATGGSVTIK